MHVLPACAHDAAPHELPIAEVVELLPLVLALERHHVLLEGQVEVAPDVLKAAREEQEPRAVRVQLQRWKISLKEECKRV